MNVKLQYKVGFLAGLYYNDTVFVNNYYVDLDLITLSSNGSDHNIALDRLKYFIDHVCSGVFFVSETETRQIKAMMNANMRLMILPEEPIDQIIGIMLFAKLNAIMEEKMLIFKLAISSDIGDSVAYLHTDADHMGPFDDRGWWSDPSPLAGEPIPVKEKGKVVKIVPTRSWSDLELNWDGEEDRPATTDSVVFVNFNKDETE